MTPGREPAPSLIGFTLVELILVMALLTIIMAISAPILSRSLRQRGLDQEATRLLALLEYGRSEAVSQGVPMTVWIAPETGRYGVEPKTGFPANQARAKDFSFPAGMQVRAEQGTASGGVIQAVEFSPDGWPVAGGVQSFQLTDSHGSSVVVARTVDQLGFEIAAAQP